MSILEQSRWTRLALLAVTAAAIGGTAILASGSAPPPGDEPVSLLPAAGVPAEADAEPAAQAAPASAIAARQSAPDARPRGPRLRTADTVWDWGVVQEGADLEHTFVLHNDGTTELRILKARPNCSCGAVVFDKAIPPGGEGRVQVKVRGLKLRAGTGLTTVELTTNDPLAESGLVLTGKVVKP